MGNNAGRTSASRISTGFRVHNGSGDALQDESPDDAAVAVAQTRLLAANAQSGVTQIGKARIDPDNRLATRPEFIPTPTIDGSTLTFAYSASDPAGNTGLGTAFLGIDLPLPPRQRSRRRLRRLGSEPTWRGCGGFFGGEMKLVMRRRPS
jgi:hypothetical protein